MLSSTYQARKLFGHGSAVMKCHRCVKRSTYSADYKKNYYGGSYVIRPADASLYRQYAREWLECNSKNSREEHFKKYGVHWFKLLHLSYMDPIRFAVVNSMHCLFLGVAK
jgi:hypothetical protein